MLSFRVRKLELSNENMTHDQLIREEAMERGYIYGHASYLMFGSNVKECTFPIFKVR